MYTTYRQQHDRRLESGRSFYRLCKSVRFSLPRDNHQEISFSRCAITLRSIMHETCHKKKIYMIVKINGKSTEEVICPKSSVPQGSHIGPILFILVTNALPNCIPGGVAILQYADDVLIMKQIREREDENNMQNAINQIVTWSQQHKLKLNETKTKVMSFTRSRKVDWGVTYSMNQHNLESVDNIKYLGVTFDRRMTFNVQANQAAANSVRTANAAGRLCKYIGNRKLNIKLFNIYNAPKIQYASIIWSRGTSMQNKLLESCHRRATRCALSTPARPHLTGYKTYEERCSALHTATLQKNRELSAAMLCAKIIEGVSITPCGNIMRGMIMSNAVARRRAPTIFTPLNRFKHGSPAHSITTILQRNGNNIDINEDSLYTIKQKLKINIFT